MLYLLCRNRLESEVYSMNNKYIYELDDNTKEFLKELFEEPIEEGEIINLGQRISKRITIGQNFLIV